MKDLKQERRLMPRFPFSKMIFKSELSFKVLNISFDGMQITSFHNQKEGDSIKGVLLWGDIRCEIRGIIKWVKDEVLGVSFDDKTKEKVEKILVPENIIKRLIPLHKTDDQEDLPQNLKYWFQSDGPYEIFIWSEGESLESFQLILLDDFIEWVDGEGIRTGKITNRKNIDTPLLFQCEYTFKEDKSINLNSLNLGKTIISTLKIPVKDQHFCLSKLDA